MKITLVTTMRNEGPYLLEWIAHHRAAGVSDFLIYTNDCDDGTDALLDVLAAAEIITHVPQIPGKRPPQWQALRQLTAAEAGGLLDLAHAMAAEDPEASAPQALTARQLDELEALLDSLAAREGGTSAGGGGSG